MHEQTFKSKNQNVEVLEKSSALSSEFEALKKIEVARTVTLRYKSCCGCGCNEYDVQRIVDQDSSLQNGDRISDLLDTDEIF